MHRGSAASCCARWPSSGQPAGCRGTGLRNTRGPYAVFCREGSGSAPPLRTYIPRARDGSCSISSTAFHELTRDGNPSPPNATAQRPERANASSGPLKRLVRRTLLLTGPLMGQHTLLDHLVGALYEGLRNREAEGLGGLQVDHQLELAGLLHGEVAGPGAFQDLVHVDGRATE